MLSNAPSEDQSFYNIEYSLPKLTPSILPSPRLLNQNTFWFQKLFTLHHPICIPNFDLNQTLHKRLAFMLRSSRWKTVAEDFWLVNSHPFNVASRWFHFCSNARDLGALIPLRKATSRRTRTFLTANLDSRAIDVEGLHVAKALLYQLDICSLEF